MGLYQKAIKYKNNSKKVGLFARAQKFREALETFSIENFSLETFSLENFSIENTSRNNDYLNQITFNKFPSDKILIQKISSQGLLKKAEKIRMQMEEFFDKIEISEKKNHNDHNDHNQHKQHNYKEEKEENEYNEINQEYKFEKNFENEPFENNLDNLGKEHYETALDNFENEPIDAFTDNLDKEHYEISIENFENESHESYIDNLDKEHYEKAIDNFENEEFKNPTLEELNKKFVLENSKEIVLEDIVSHEVEIGNTEIIKNDNQEIEDINEIENAKINKSKIENKDIKEIENEENKENQENKEIEKNDENENIEYNIDENEIELIETITPIRENFQSEVNNEIENNTQFNNETINTKKEFLYVNKFYESIINSLKEIQESTNKEKFWTIFCNTIVKELNVSNILVFSEKEYQDINFLYPIFHFGSETFPNGEFQINKGLVKFLEKNDYIYKIEDLPLSLIKSSEKKILEEQNAKIILGLKSKDESQKLEALILIGPKKKLNELELIPFEKKEIDFLEQLLQLTTSEYLRIKGINEISKQKLLNLETYRNIFNITHEALQCQNLQELNILFKESLEEYIGVISYSFSVISLETQSYKIIGSKGLGFESRKKFNLKIDSNILSALHSSGRIYILSDYKNNFETIQNYSKRDLELIQNFWIVPLLFNNNLIGILNIYDLKNKNWDKSKQELTLAIVEILTPHVLHLMIKDDPEILNFIQDPLFPLKRYFNNLIKTNSLENENNKKIISIVDLRLPKLQKNSENLEKHIIHRFLSLLNQSINMNLTTKDYLKPLANNHYVIILYDKNYEEASLWLKKLQNEIPKYLLPFKNKNQNYKKVKYKFNLYTSFISNLNLDNLLKMFE